MPLCGDKRGAYLNTLLNPGLAGGENPGVCLPASCWAGQPPTPAEEEPCNERPISLPPKMVRNPPSTDRGTQKIDGGGLGVGKKNKPRQDRKKK